MAKKRKHAPKLTKSSPEKKKDSLGDSVTTGDNYPTEEIKWWREAVEGLVVAVVLALLIRGFEAEAFVIPTGSMAPTLRGKHKDVLCEQCGFEYAAGASNELEVGRVEQSICTMCAFPQDIEYDVARDATSTGDRILVNKFSYDPLGKPERFDVIVFKNPNDAKQNYIKRLCGLPGETVKLFHGDIYVKPMELDATNYVIARKPPKKQLAMMQPVHDTKYIPASLDKAGLPPRWQPQNDAWSTPDTNRTFSVNSGPQTSWLRYKHIVPDQVEWAAIKRGEKPIFQGTRGELISDSYAYNTFLNQALRFPSQSNGRSMLNGHVQRYYDRVAGKSWVGDLAVEVNAEIESDSGELVLELIEGGWHFQCLIDVATGRATMSIIDHRGQPRPFDTATTVSANTAVKGQGSHRLLFSNIDSQLRLWVDGKLLEFDAATTYMRGKSGFGITPEEAELRPFYGGPNNPGDLSPAGVGAKGLKAKIERLQIHRDKYYIGVSSGGGLSSDPTGGDYRYRAEPDVIRGLFRQPEQWSTSTWFEKDRMLFAEFDLEDSDDDSKDQFFPMGDNSPQSHDARVWSLDNYVERQFLIGEAVFIYYPHPWHAKLPGKKFRTVPLVLYPKFSRMGLIR